MKAGIRHEEFEIKTEHGVFGVEVVSEMLRI